MYQDEYNNGIKKLRHKWPNIFSEDQITMMWDRWRSLPDNIFKPACEMILFKCTATPSGERIQEEINKMLELRSQNQSANKPQNNNCLHCSGQGYQIAQNNEGNQIPFLCISCGGKDIKFNYPMPRWIDVERLGYKKKAKFSKFLKNHKDWVDADKSLYSPKLQAIFSIAQRAVKFNELRGLKGINKMTGLNQDEIFKIYELMLQKNTSDQLITKNNNVDL